MCLFGWKDARMGRMGGEITYSWNKDSDIGGSGQFNLRFDPSLIDPPLLLTGSTGSSGVVGSISRSQTSPMGKEGREKGQGIALTFVNQLLRDGFQFWLG